MASKFDVASVCLGEIIKTYRAELGLNQEKLSELTDLSTNTLSKIENGAENVKVTNLDKLARAFGTTSSDLLDRRDQRMREVKAARKGVSSKATSSVEIIRPVARPPETPISVTKATGVASEGLFASEEGPKESDAPVPEDPSDAAAMIPWIADVLLTGYAFDIVAMVGSDGRRYPLPTESASMANMLETTLVEHLGLVAGRIDGVEVELPRSTRVYPDIAFTGPALKDQIVACDIKVARRDPANRNRTQSRITLYTGNTYFRDPVNNTQNIMHPFDSYALHLDCVALYDFITDPNPAVTNVELVVVEPWRIASHQRSSGTRNYIGAINDIAAIREGRGEFSTKEDFYLYWRSYEGWNTSSRRRA